MGSKRKIIRNEIVDILQRASIVNRKSLRASRSTVYEIKDLPAISVYTRQEEIEERSEAPREGRRNLSLVIEVIVADSEDNEASDKLDAIVEKIESTLTEDDTIDCSADDIILRRIDFDFEGENFEKPIHSASMEWLVKYRDYFPRGPRSDENEDLETIHADWDFAPPDGDIEAQDDITIPT